jgi:DnaJ-class molecular chaperone
VAEARDYYGVLGVPRDADQKVIKDAFRRLALKYHPDRSKGPGTAERFKEVVEAYDVVNEPKKRAEYDGGGRPASQASRKRTCSAASISNICPADSRRFRRSRGGATRRVLQASRRDTGEGRGSSPAGV